jgi:hypothetical protein
MSINNIYCFGDGYAHGHIWPEWPQILQTLLPDHTVIIVSGVGAGPEYLVTQFSELLPLSGKVIFQWPQPNRFDKIIEDNNWAQIVKNDPVYHFNTYIDGHKKWWLSSASTNSDVRVYHNKYIQPVQANIRLKTYQTLVRTILENTDCQYTFTSTHEQEIYSRQNLTIRGSEIQPSPLSHFDFLLEKIMPAINLHNSHAQILKDLITEQLWIPYDPNREEIWANLKDRFKTLSDK